MGILSGPLIQQYIETSVRGGDLPYLVIDPFDPAHVGANSYDLHLGDILLKYVLPAPVRDSLGYRITRDHLDPRESNPLKYIRIPEDGFVIRPGEFYLGSLRELVECHGLVPCLETRSSAARLGISTHLSAGLGDDGFAGCWTLELTAAVPVRIYAGMRIAQMVFHTLEGDRKPYAGKYNHSTGPVASRMYLDGGA